MARDWITGLLLIVVLDQGTSVPHDRQEIERRLKAEYEGKVVWLRDFCGGSRCRYSPDGSPLEGGKPGPWTLSGGVEVRQVRLLPDRLVIRGNRLSQIYDHEQKKFKNLRSRNEVEILVSLSAVVVSNDSLRRTLQTIFVSGESLPEWVPSHWKEFLSKTVSDEKQDLNNPYCGETEKGEKVYRVGNAYGVAPPRLRSRTEPNYTDEALQAGLEGTVVIAGVISREGKLANPRIVEPIGMGLDDSAVQTVLKWRFDPALRDGQPVAACARFEVAFRLMKR